MNFYPFFIFSVFDNCILYLNDYFCDMVKKLKKLRTFNWIVLNLIFLVVVAGSFVRVTGSGMGCPDWPKCFGYWVPPTDEKVLPENYKETYVEGRLKKIEKFSRFLAGIGLEETAQKIQNDPNLLTEQEFNAAKTWTEYVNRLCGFLAGNSMLVAFFWLLKVYRKRKFILLSVLNLILMGFQGWFGSIVVASNLVPWVITVHMLVSLFILALQLYLIHLIGKEIELHSDSLRSSNDSPVYSVPKWMYWLIVVSFIITIYQIFLGTGVRESIDAMTNQGVVRKDWTEQLGMPFFIHRSFSWLVLLFVALIAWKNEQLNQFKPIRWMAAVFTVELITGVVLAYFNMPGFAQIIHLVLAMVLFCIFVMMMFRMRMVKAA
jgi:heme a synthase